MLAEGKLLWVPPLLWSMHGHAQQQRGWWQGNPPGHRDVIQSTSGELWLHGGHQMNTDFLLKLICKARIAPFPTYTSPFSSWPLSVSSLCWSCLFCIALLITVTNEPEPP